MLRYSSSFAVVACIGFALTTPAFGQDESDSQEQQGVSGRAVGQQNETNDAPDIEPKAEPKNVPQPSSQSPGMNESEQTRPQSKPKAQPQRSRVNQQKAQGKHSKKSTEAQSEPQQSPFFPDWQPNKQSIDVRPVVGFTYLKLPFTNASVVQGELGGYLGIRGVSIKPGNPGLQIEPGAGYAVGYAFKKESGKSVEDGGYRRAWGSLRTPIYYRFVRQEFAGQYGEVRGGPLPVSKRGVFQSDTGIALMSYVSTHYTFTYDRAYGEGEASPEIKSYDHWLHGRFSAPVLNFFIDAGPGFSKSMSVVGAAQARSSGAYLLGLSGLDLFTDKIGFEASAKYMFTSQTDVDYFPSTGRSPLEDLGAQPVLVGMPADSLNASAFFGLRRVIGVMGIGWRYNLQILNYSETNNTKQQKQETFGFGIDAKYSF